MNHDPMTTLQALRALMPKRGLAYHEAQGIAERQAIRLLDTLDQREPPVDVGLIAELPRIEVRVVPGQDLAGLSGASQWVREHARWLIAINGDDSQTRRRFTLGHEFKHILDSPSIRGLYPDPEYPTQTLEERTERMCDYFGACLLMPRTWVKRLWAQGVQDTATLAATFNVSPAAMAIRLQQLGLTEARSRWRGQITRTYFRQSPVLAVSPAI